MPVHGIVSCLQRGAEGDADVIVGSVPTLGRKGSLRLSQLDPREFKAVFIDEAHHVAASTYMRIINYFGCGVRVTVVSLTFVTTSSDSDSVLRA